MQASKSGRFTVEIILNVERLKSNMFSAAQAGWRVWLVALALCACCARSLNAYAEPTLTRLEFNQPQMGAPFRIVMYARDKSSPEAPAAAAFHRFSNLTASLAH